MKRQLCYLLLLALSAPLLHAEFAYVANYSSNNVSAFTIDATTGTLYTRSRFPFRNRW